MRPDPTLGQELRAQPAEQSPLEQVLSKLDASIGGVEGATHRLLRRLEPVCRDVVDAEILEEDTQRNSSIVVSALESQIGRLIALARSIERLTERLDV